MFEYGLQQNRWVILGLGMGVILTLAVVLSYMAAWVKRYKIPSNVPETDGERIPTLHAIPWILTVTYAGIIIYGIVYYIVALCHPPNW